MKGNPLSSVLDPSVVLLTSLVYFVQGALSIAGIALPFLLRQSGWGVSEISTFSFWIGLPWAFKLLYGALTDAVPLGRYRRKPYVIGASVLSSAGWLGLAFFHQDPTWIYVFLLTANVGFAITDVVTDAIVIEHSTPHTTQGYQSLAWGFRSLGAILGGFLGGWLAQNVPYARIFALTALLPLATFLAGLWVQEVPFLNKGRGLLGLWVPLKDSLKALFRGDLPWFVLFLVFGTLSSAFSTPFFFYLKEHLGFSETFLGSLSSVTWLGAVVGCFVYGKLFAQVSMKSALYWSLALNFINVLSSYAVIGRLSAGVLFFLGGVAGYVSLLPLLAAAAVLSRQKGVEGSLFALLMSIYNLGQILATFAGGKLFDRIGLFPLIFLSGGVGLAGFLFVPRLKTLNGR